MQDMVRDDDDEASDLILRAIVDYFQTGGNMEKILKAMQAYSFKKNKYKVTGYASQRIDVNMGFLMHDNMGLAIIS